MNVLFKGWNCRVWFDRYQEDDSTAITLREDGTNELIARATVCLAPDITLQLDDDKVLIKTWSENKGMYRALLEAGVIKCSLLGVELPHGSVARVCQLTDAAMAERLIQSIGSEA